MELSRVLSEQSRDIYIYNIDHEIEKDFAF